MKHSVDVSDPVIYEELTPIEISRLRRHPVPELHPFLIKLLSLYHIRIITLIGRRVCAEFRAHRLILIYKSGRKNSRIKTISFSGSVKLLQCCGLYHVVRIKEVDILSLCQLKSAITRRRKPAVHLIIIETDPHILPEIRLHHGTRTICTAVIYAYYFDVGERLGNYTVQTVSHVSFNVINRYNNRNQNVHTLIHSYSVKCTPLAFPSHMPQQKLCRRNPSYPQACSSETPSVHPA